MSSSCRCAVARRFTASEIAAFRALRHKIVEPPDGARARASVAASLPELVILDLILPHVNGLQLLAEWRSQPRTADLPVLVLTSKDLTTAERTYLRENAGALRL